MSIYGHIDNLKLYPNLWDKIIEFTDEKYWPNLALVNKSFHIRVRKHFRNEDIFNMALNGMICSIKHLGDVMDYNSCAQGAIKGGNHDIIDYIISKGYHCEYNCLIYAFRYGNIAIATKYSTENKIANEFLELAAENGHFELVKRFYFDNAYHAVIAGALRGNQIDIFRHYFIADKSNGCYDFIYDACYGGNINLINKVMSNYKKFTEIDYEIGLEGACVGGKLDIVILMAEKIRNRKDRSEAVSAALNNGHIDIAEFLLKSGFGFGYELEQIIQGGHLNSLKFISGIVLVDLATIEPQWYGYYNGLEFAKWALKNMKSEKSILDYFGILAQFGHLHIIDELKLINYVTDKNIKQFYSILSLAINEKYLYIADYMIKKTKVVIEPTLLTLWSPYLNKYLPNK